MDKDLYRMLMREAKEIILLSSQPKYDLMHEEGLQLYDKWAPYVLDNIPAKYVNSPGYKMAFTQVMSVLLAIKSEKRFFNITIPVFDIEEKEDNIINFLNYKRTKQN